MAPQLDLSDSKLLFTPPRINLRRAASYNSYERSQNQDFASSSSSQHPLGQLLYSPPPSPSLPSLVPRRKRSSSNPFLARPTRLIRLVIYLISFLALIYCITFLLKQTDLFSLLHNGHSTQMVAQDDLPDFPTPIVIDNSRGHSKWTISIPKDYQFPLSMEDYAEMTKNCRLAAIRQTAHHSQQSSQKPLGINHFVDIAEAEKTNLLPSSHVLPKTLGTDHFVGLTDDHITNLPTCQTSMTYALESTDAGLGTAIMSMWTAYGLSRALNRAFFVDDSRWAYGKYTDIFDPPPLPNCRPPPRHHILPCPAKAKHLVISQANAHEILPDLLSNLKSRPKTSERQQLFELAHLGYEALFKLNKDDEAYTTKRIRDFQKRAKARQTSSTDAPIIGLHIRRGDRHPLEFQYKDTYIPTHVYLSKALDLIDKHYNETAGADLEEKLDSIGLLASDDPHVHGEAELSHLSQAQDRIMLASKDNIEAATKNPHVLHPFVEDTFGWEGGFFAPMFWNLGSARKNNAANAPSVSRYEPPVKAVSKMRPSEQTLKLRSLLGRAYMMDLAVLSGASDRVVCAVSAMGCRILAVMMGWEDGIESGKWVNVDGGYEWRGLDF